MEIVINIDENLYTRLFDNGDIDAVDMLKACVAICKGTLLPEGHGDLIDRNDLLKHYDNTTYHNGIEERKIHFVQIGYVKDAHAIIKADRVESEE